MADNEEKFSVDTEQLKNETKETVNQVKDSIKNVDLKKDAEETKGFLKEMFSNPFEAVRRVAEDEENVLSKVIVLMIMWIAATLIAGVIGLMKYRYSGIGNNIMKLVSYILNPVFYVTVPAIIILIMNKNNRKSLITIISTLVIAGVPVILIRIIDIVEVLVSGISIISGPVSTMLSVIAIILEYVGMKDLFAQKENNEFIKKYAIIKLLAAFVLVILTRIGIN